MAQAKMASTAFFFPLLVLLVCVVKCQQVVDTHAEAYPILDDVILVDNVIFDVTMRSTLDCARVCNSRPSCKYFTIASRSSTVTSCRGHGGYVTSNSTMASVPGARSFVNDRLPEGYSVEVSTGMCYKVHYETASFIQARDSCWAEGGELLTVDTRERRLLFYNNFFVYGILGYFVGAARPEDEWGMPWTNTSTFNWLRTGRSQSPMNKTFQCQRPKYDPNLNCLYALFAGPMVTAEGKCGIFMDEDCQRPRRFICERFDCKTPSFP